MMGLRASGVLGVCLLLASGIAFAQPKPPTDAQKQQAGDLVKKAIARSQGGDHEGAIKLYLEAYDIVPNALLLSNVASEYQTLKKSIDALRYFCMYLDKDPTGTNATYASSQAKVLQKELGQPDTVACPKEPPKPVNDPVPPPVTPVVTDPVPQPETPPEGGKTMRTVGLAVGGVGIATLGVGVYFGLQAKKHHDVIQNGPADEEIGWTAEELSSETKGPDAEKKQIIFSVAGGVVAATGIVVYFLGRSKKGESKVVVVPTATPDSVGVTVAGGF